MFKHVDTFKAKCFEGHTRAGILCSYQSCIGHQRICIPIKSMMYCIYLYQKLLSCWKYGFSDYKLLNCFVHPASYCRFLDIFVLPAYACWLTVVISPLSICRRHVFLGHPCYADISEGVTRSFTIWSRTMCYTILRHQLQLFQWWKDGRFLLKLVCKWDMRNCPSILNWTKIKTWFVMIHFSD